jgi:hypothetical protein
MIKRHALVKRLAWTVIFGRRFSARNFMKEARENGATVIQYVGETLRYLLGPPIKQVINPSIAAEL